jgi:HEAT repeat protein
MRRTLLGWLGVLLLTGTGEGLRAAGPPSEGGPRALIRRAIRAMGGEELLTRRLAVQRRYRLRYEGQPGGATVETTGETWTQAGGRPRRFVYRSEPGRGLPAERVFVFNGDKSWRSEDGRVEDYPAADREKIGPYRHADRVAGLVALLTDKRFRLSPFPGGTVDGRPADGVKVSYEGRQDVRVYFDRASGLPVRHAFKVKRGGKEVLWDVTLRDHRDLSGAGDERVLKDAGLATDDRTLLDLLRRQARDPARLARARELARRLGDDSFGVREKAEAELRALGPQALPALRKAAKDRDPEVRKRARRCLKRIEKTGGNAVVVAAVRQLALRRSAGATEVMLRLLPGADEPLVEEVRAALAALAVRDGKPDPAIRAALKAKDPAVRKAAEAVLGKDGGAYLKRPGRRLFVRGPRLQTKSVFSIEGEGERTLETVEVIYYNSLDDKLFARP